MIEAIVIWFFLLLVLLFLLLGYVVAPAAVLWAFFRSEWLPRAVKIMLGVGEVVVFIGWAGARYLDYLKRQVEAASRPHGPAVRLTVQEAGLLPYPLGRGSLDESCYDSARWLVVSGDLPSGQRLQAHFRASAGFTRPNETNVVAVSLDDSQPIQALGHSIYEPDSQKVSGYFRCVLPSGKQIVVSFPPTSVVLPKQ